MARGRPRRQFDPASGVSEDAVGVAEDGGGDRDLTRGAVDVVDALEEAGYVGGEGGFVLFAVDVEYRDPCCQDACPARAIGGWLAEGAEAGGQGAKDRSWVTWPGEEAA